MNCRTVQELLLTEYLDGEGPAGQRARVEAHLRVCDRCRAVEAAVRQRLVEPFNALGRVTVPESVWTRTCEQIAERSGRGRRSGIRKFREGLEAVLTPRRSLALGTLCAVMFVSVVTLRMFLPLERPVPGDETEYVAYLLGWPDGTGNGAGYGSFVEEMFL